MLKVRLLLLIIINIFIDKIHIFIDIVKLNNKYALNNKYIFITEKSAPTCKGSFSLFLRSDDEKVVKGAILSSRC